MRKLVYYIGSTIDGYIAGPNGEFDFFPLAEDVAAFIHSEYPETIPSHIRSHTGFDAPNRHFDTVIMGRATYQPALEIGVTSPYAHLRQCVVSTSIQSIDDPEVELVTQDPTTRVRQLKEEEGLDIWLAGGSRLASTLLPEVDEMIIKRYPVVAGSGIPLLLADFRPQRFTVADERTFSDGTTFTTFARVQG